jgi:hypothetical protein
MKNNESHHRDILSDTIPYLSHIFVVLLSCFCWPESLPGTAFTYPFEGGSSIVFRIPRSSPVTKEVLNSKYYPAASQIVAKLIQIQQEEENREIPRTARFEFLFSPEDRVPSFARALLRITSPLVEKQIRIFRLTYTHSRLLYLRFHELSNQDSGLFYDFYNIEFDGKGRTLRSVILKSDTDKSIPCKEPFILFREGKEIQYKGFTASGLPTAYRSKTFVLNKNGLKQCIRLKECSNRMFNPNGLLSGETTQETRYTYKQGEPCLIYNVRLDKRGKIVSYDFLFPRIEKSPLSQASCYHCLVQESSPIKEKKIIRQYLFSQGKRQFQSGSSREAEFDMQGRLVCFHEAEFKIKPGSDGLKEDERFEGKDHYVWNTSFSPGNRVLTRRIIKTIAYSFELNGKKENCNLLASLREVHFLEEEENLKKVTVCFYDLGKDLVWIPLRQVTIDILEMMKNDIPSKINLSILSPNNPLDHCEQSILQDCDYILEEAVFGDLFLPQKKSSNFDVHVQKLSDKGEIGAVVLFYFKNENGKKIYTGEKNLSFIENS